MSSGFDEYWDRKIRQNNIPEEFGGPVTGTSGKQYAQLEFDFEGKDEENPHSLAEIFAALAAALEAEENEADTEADPHAFLHQSDEQLDANKRKAVFDAVVKREEATNLIMQANAIVKLVMDHIGEGNRDFDNQEFALWGASELLEKATSVLE